jgi:uncharacterized membrane protein
MKHDSLARFAALAAFGAAALVAAASVTPATQLPKKARIQPWQVMPLAERLADDALAASGAVDPCTQTADIMAWASVRGLLEELGIAAGHCVNLETEAEVFECLDEALAAYAEGLELVDDQYDARIELCDKLGGGNYDPDISPQLFDDDIDNVLLPYMEGATWVYQSLTSEGLEEIVVTVIENQEEIVDEIECRIVRDVVTLDGVVIEDTLDYYAQHDDGTVWYFGERVQNFEDGVLVSLDGSWLGDVDDAQQGIVMLASPTVGTTYRQELQLDVAEDYATVLSIDERVDVPYGSFDHCIQTEDRTPLEPDHVEHKYYAPGVGLVLEVNPVTGDRVELVSFTPGKN